MKGIIIMGHGSKLDYNKDVMNIQADRLREKGYKNVYVGFNEMSEPSIEDALKTMVNDGVDTIFAMPLFIASGVHMTEDIRKKLNMPKGSRDAHVELYGKKVHVKYGEAVGGDPRIADILDEQIRQMS